jgi:hypothetical protein
MRIIDIIIITAFLIVLVIIIGLNIVSLIDKKLGNVEVIVPPVKPNIIVQVDKNDLVYCLNDQDKTIINKHNKKEIEGFESTKITESKPNITNPDSSNIINYGDYVCYKKKEEPKEQVKKEDSPKCNSSINNKFTYGSKKINQTIGGSGTCPQEKLPLNWYDIDPSLYYKVNKPPIIPIEDELVKGYNIGTFGGNANPFEIGRINLNNYSKKYAEPNNYIL